MATQYFFVSLIIVHCRNIFPFSSYILLAFDTLIVTWTPNVYFYGLWHITLIFANILERLFNTL